MPATRVTAERGACHSMRRRIAILLVTAAALIAGCKDGADAFFSGRPSEMSMVHNRIIGGPPEAMVELLRVPSRFPEATETQIALWQESALAWWLNPEGRGTMTRSFDTLARHEMHELRTWIRVRDKHRDREKAQVLDAIEAALDAFASAPQAPHPAKNN
jgi:hypothetical protein